MYPNKGMKRKRGKTNVMCRVLVFFVVATFVAVEVYFALSLLTGITANSFGLEEIIALMAFPKAVLMEGRMALPEAVVMAGGAAHADSADSDANMIHFRDFASNPKYHNRTVNGEAIPGSFFDDQLFLIGARLTTSYVPNVTQVHVDVFGFPGDWLEVKEKNLNCDPGTFANEWKFFPMNDFSGVDSPAALYCQLECKRGHTAEPNDCGEPIRMLWIQPISGDSNQDGTTLIWRCDVSKHLSKHDLLRQAAAGKQSSVRVRIFIKHKNQKVFRHLPVGTTSNTTHHPVTQIDIPLHTGVVGYGGPHIRHSEHGYFSPHQQENPMNIGLCLTMYGKSSIRYAPEFVQHHMNVGISHIVIGMEANMDSEEFNLAEQLLRPYIDTGFVVLQATGLNDYFTCDSEVPRLHFYNQCLYYFKGLSEYSAAWDLDEYWMPSARLEVTGTGTFAHEHQGGGKVDAVVPDNNTGTVIQQRFIERSDASAFSPLATSDPLWQESNYSKSISIWDVIKAIEKFHTMHHKCGGKWCYTLFPSTMAHMKKNVVRTHRIKDDFDRRNVMGSSTWKKAITRTQIAMTGGIHLPGSCQFHNDPHFYMFAKDGECYPHMWESGEFGLLHHFKSLIAERETWGIFDEVIEDEYVVSFAHTVSKQLDRHNESVMAAIQAT